MWLILVFNLGLKILRNISQNKEDNRRKVIQDRLQKKQIIFNCYKNNY